MLTPPKNKRELNFLTVDPEFGLGGRDAAAVFSCAAIDAHVGGQHGGNDELVAALLVLVDHVMVVLRQQFAVFVPANGGGGLSDHNAVKADWVTVRDILTL